MITNRRLSWTINEPQTNDHHHDLSSWVLREALADVRGLNASFFGYKEYLNGLNQNEDETLPRLDLTSDQLLFVSQAHLWCFNSDPETIKSKLRDDFAHPFMHSIIIEWFSL